MKPIHLSLVALTLCSVSLFAAEGISLEAVSIEEEKTIQPTVDAYTAISVQDESSPSSTLNETLKSQFYVSNKQSGSYN